MFIVISVYSSCDGPGPIFILTPPLTLTDNIDAGEHEQMILLVLFCCPEDRQQTVNKNPDVI